MMFSSNAALLCLLVVVGLDLGSASASARAAASSVAPEALFEGWEPFFEQSYRTMNRDHSSGVSRDELQLLLTAADTDGDGETTVTEVMAAMKSGVKGQFLAEFAEHEHSLSMGELIINLADITQDGKLTVSELMELSDTNWDGEIVEVEWFATEMAMRSAWRLTQLRNSANFVKVLQDEGILFALQYYTRMEFGLV